MKQYILPAIIITLICLYCYKDGISQEQIQLYKQQNSKLIEEKQLLLTQIKNLKKETIIVETTTKDGVIKKITKIKEESKESTKSDLTTNKEKVSILTSKQSVKKTFKSPTIGVLFTTTYSLMPTIKPNITITSPIFGPISAQGLIGVDQIGVGLTMEIK